MSEMTFAIQLGKAKEFTRIPMRRGVQDKFSRSSIPLIIPKLGATEDSRKVRFAESLRKRCRTASKLDQTYDSDTK
jgi:hypothetical protein